jgi:hypothetical protein
MIQPQPDRVSLADFLAWELSQDGKHELLGGEILAFSGGSFDHNDIALNVCRLLDDRVAPPCEAHNSDTIIETRGDAREERRKRSAGRCKRRLFERRCRQGEVHAASTTESTGGRR